MSVPRKPQFATQSRQRGMALVTGMLLLIVVTILAISMFRSYGVQTSISGNVREKQRAVSAAISAQQYAEYWLSSNSPPVAGLCAGPPIPSSMGQVCSNTPLDFSVVPWTIAGKQVGIQFNNFNTTPGVNVTTTPAQGSFYTAPLFYVTDLGLSASGPGEVYQIDATGWGATQDTVAVVESTYLITPPGRSYDK